MTAAGDHDGTRVFNSTFEAGVRATFLLTVIYPESVDLEELIALDHLVVHSADVGGPPSLHPATKTHATEMLVRRDLIQRGLLLMQSKLLVERIAHPSRGLLYRGGEEAQNFVSYLHSTYFSRLHTAAAFLAAIRDELGKDKFAELVEQQLEKWAIQFQSDDAPGAGP